MKRLCSHHSSTLALKAFRCWWWRERSLCPVSGELGHWHSWLVVLSNVGTLQTLVFITHMNQIAQRSDVVLCCNNSWDAALRGAGQTEPLAGAATEAAPTLWLVANARQHTIVSLHFFSCMLLGCLRGKEEEEEEETVINVLTHLKIRISPQKKSP